MMKAVLAASNQAGKELTSASASLRLRDLPTPAFIINRHAFEKNCHSMLEMTKDRGLSLRPHVKTHKTPQGACIQVAGKAWSEEQHETLGVVTGFVASTIPEVSMLVNAAPQHGKPFRDILYGVPISEPKLPSLDVLRRTIPNGHIHIMVDHPTQVAFVEDYVKDIPDSLPFTAFLKLDTGYHRAGITCDERGVQLAVRILESPFLELKGVYSHCGHAYNENSKTKRTEIANVDMQQIQSFLELLKDSLESSEHRASVDNLTVSVGSTPSARHHFSTVGLSRVEIHPGNYTLYDRQQQWTGACTEPDLAGRVISRVIGHYEDRNTIMLDAGALALTKDSTPQGGVCAIGGHPELDCYSMSQEVILVRPKDTRALFPFDKFPLGSVVNLLPNHSCLAAACFEKYFVIDDPLCLFSPENTVVDEWIPAKFFTIPIPI